MNVSYKKCYQDILPVIRKFIEQNPFFLYEYFPTMEDFEHTIKRNIREREIFEYLIYLCCLPKEEITEEDYEVQKHMQKYLKKLVN